MNDRFFWRDSLKGRGRVGKIPGINVFLGEELPPIDKANNVACHLLDSSVPEESRLIITWAMEEGTVIRADVKAKDERMKKQYARNPEFAERILEMLLNSIKR